MLFCVSFLAGRKKTAVPLCVSKDQTDVISTSVEALRSVPLLL